MARSPIVGGVVLAAGAAIAFGATTPIVAWAGRDTGAFATAALLYFGAAAASLLVRLARGTDAPLRRSDATRVIAVALVGGALAPALLAWGLQHASATVGSLVLNLEAAFTVALAALLYREPVGGRVALAVAVMVAAGSALALDAWRHSTSGVAGVIAIAGATAAWALDNTLGRPLSERDPLEVVIGKGALGAALSAIVALAIGDPWPTVRAGAILVGCGATGYGMSLRLYLLAQRRIGAGRTGSVFALAPFVGAALAIALGDRGAGMWTLAAAALFAVGVILHLTERHGHAHVHAAVDHDHPHRHDDEHHDHTHEPPILGEHAHPHHHDHVEHAHEHAPDPHHAHTH